MTKHTRTQDLLRVVREEVPDGALRIASKRVAPFLHNFRLMDYNLQILMVNCYLQGLRDAVETAVNRGLFPAEQLGEFAFGGEGI